MATDYDVCVHIVYEHHAISCASPRGQVILNLYRGCAHGDCMKIVQNCNPNAVAETAVSAPSAQKLYRVCAASMQRLHGDGVVTVAPLPFLSLGPPRGARVGIVRCQSTTCLWAMDL